MSVSSYITEAAGKFGLSEQLLRAVIDAESSGNQDAVSPAGAIGLMQLMPGTAADLGVNPHDPRENVLGGAKYLRQMLDRYNGDVQKALAAYNAGPKAVDDHGGIPPYEETRNYVSKIAKALGGGGSFGLTGLGGDTDPFGAPPTQAENKPIEAKGFWARGKDKFLNQFYDNNIIGAARLLMSNIVNSGHVPEGAEGYRIGHWEPTVEDFDLAHKLLPGDKAAQRWALMNATSPQHFQYLLSMKKEDAERAQQVDGYGYDATTAFSVAGALADPLNFVPLFQEAKAVQVLSKIIPKSLINTGKAAKWAAATMKPVINKAEIGATQSALMYADRSIAEDTTGYKQDPEMAAKFGALAGVGMSLLGDLSRAAFRTKEGQKVIGALHNLEDHAYASLTGAQLPQELRKVSADDLGRIHDQAFLDASGNKVAADLGKSGKLYVTTREALQDLAGRWGKNIDPTARAFHDPETGLTVFVKDNIAPGTNLQGLIDHEVGAHKGLKGLLGDEGYAKLMDDVRAKGVKGEGAWGDAYRAVPDGNPIEALGNWLERTAGTGGTLDGLTGKVRTGLRKLGLTNSYTDAEIRDLIHKAVKNEIEGARGFTLLPNGDVAMDGMLYSKNSLTNPHTWSDMHDLMPDVRKEAQGVDGWRGWLGHTLETWGPFATIHGTLKNSLSPLARQFADTMFHDARMRTYKGQLVMSAEKMKEEIRTKLLPYWNSYMDTRNEFIFGDNIKDYVGNVPNIRNFHARAQEFNRQVRECYNATYTNPEAKSNNGLSTIEWAPQVKKAASTIDDLRNRIIELAKKSSSMFGTKVIDVDPMKALEREIERKLAGEAGEEVVERGARNMLGPDWKTWDNELWRLRDDQKWSDFTQMFPTVEHAVKKMEEYGHLAVKRDVLRQKLLAERQREWEVDKGIHDRKVEKYKKDMEGHKAAKAEWDKKVKEYETALQKYAVDHLDWAAKGKKGEEPKKPQRTRGKQPTAPRKPPDLREKPATVDERDLQQYVDNEVYGWATGQVDRNLHNIDDHETPDHMPYLHERLPLDTTTKMELKDGVWFSYDAQPGVHVSLRDDNFDRVIPKIIDRLSGEMALMNVFPSQAAIDEARKRISKQLEAAVKTNKLPQNAMDKQLLAFDEGIDHIRGVRTDRQRKQNGLWEAFGRMAQSLSYAQNGANMGWNQVGEVGGAIGHVGGRAVFHIVPVLGRLTEDIMNGKVKAEYLKDGARMLYGDTADRYLWSNTASFESRMVQEATGQVHGAMKSLDKVNSGLNAVSRMTSELNFLPRLTDMMLRGLRRDALGDSVAWAQGVKFNKFRNPFSDSKLKAAGVDNKMAQRIRESLNKYTKFDAEGNPLRTDWEEWAAKDATSFYKFKFLIDQQSMRAMQQDTIGNRAMMKDAGVGYRVMLQFKDFTLKAVNGQTMRFLSNPEWDTGMAALYGMASNAAVFALLSGMRAEAYFHNDQAKKQSYLAEKLAPATLVKAGILRNAITGAPTSFLQDAYEAYTGDQLYRTTVDRTYQYKQQRGDKDFGDVVGDYAEQLPAVRAATSVWSATKFGYKAAAPWERVDKRDLMAFERSFPLANWIPAAYIAAEVNDSIPLPAKLPKQK